MPTNIWGTFNLHLLLKRNYKMTTSSTAFKLDETELTNPNMGTRYETEANIIKIYLPTKDKETIVIEDLVHTDDYSFAGLTLNKTETLDLIEILKAWSEQMV
jgi:hypothetical protein